MESTVSGSNELKGLGGWLTVLGIVLLGAAIKQINYAITLPELIGSLPTYPFLQWGLIFELVGSTAIVGFIGYLLYLYQKKDKRFPKLLVIFFVSYIAYAILDYIIVGYLPNIYPELAESIEASLSEAVGVIGVSVVSAIIWSAYVNQSTRVKNTFINQGEIKDGVHCIKCGSKQTKDTKFCTKCGNKIAI